MKMLTRIFLRSLNHIKPFTGLREFSSQVKKWDIVAAVCLERLPLVTPNLSPNEKKYFDHLVTLEIENSMKSNHEMKHENDLLASQLLKEDSKDVDMDAISKITAQDFEDASTEEIANFKPAPIETEADKKNDQKSLQRMLQSHLILLTENHVGADKKYFLPQGKHNDGETLRETADRVLKESCGDSLVAQIYGNAPCGFYKYKYPGNNESGSTGAKIFFYYARHLSGQVKDDTQYKWLSRNELSTTLPAAYHSSVSDFLIDETS